MASTDDDCKTKTDAQAPVSAPDLAEYLKAIGAQACTTEHASSQTNVDTRVGAGNIFAKIQVDGSVHTNVESGSSIGCEQILAESNIYRDTVNNVKCTLAKISSSAKNQMQTTQELKIGGKDCPSTPTIKCTTFSAKQSITADTSALATLSTEDVTKISSIIQDGLKQITNSKLKNDTGWGATPEGQKVLKNIQADLVKNDVQNKISKLSTDALNSSINFQSQTWCANIDINGPCGFDQTMVLTQVAKSMVGASFDNWFTSDIKTEMIQQQTDDLDAKSGAAPTAAPANFKPFDSDSSIFAMLGGIMCFIILAVLAYKLLSSKEATQNLSNLHSQFTGKSKSRMKMKRR